MIEFTLVNLLNIRARERVLRNNMDKNELLSRFIIEALRAHEQWNKERQPN